MKYTEEIVEYFAWDPDGRCSDGFRYLDDAEVAAMNGDYRYVVLGCPQESIEIVIDMKEDRASESGFSDVLDFFEQNA